MPEAPPLIPPQRGGGKGCALRKGRDLGILRCRFAGTPFNSPSERGREGLRFAKGADLGILRCRFAGTPLIPRQRGGGKGLRSDFSPLALF